ncbi:MAG TPA: hypothetical protein DEO54_04255 [Rikenellaceae bacterium]|jgi:N-methylhydantoinase B/oxoprolinase/acetone carboxylase alpha subunit|nr:MAG: hypothetical protein CVU10_05265 [Bacteroidetes bacterium HGW-Bacteroidetes-5]HBZ25438.1 hypothetical protein [Rikenellaceae bacterium]
MDSIVELYAGDLWECEILKTLLNDRDIDCFLRNDIRAAYGPLGSLAQSVRIMVRDTDLSTAQEVVTEFLENRKKP